MPVVACTRQGKKGYKYGQAGKCYTYNAGDEKGRKEAKRKAYLQGAAIEANTGEDKLNKYNTCHGANGRFCGGGGGGGKGGGGGGGGGGGAAATEETPTISLTHDEQQAIYQYSTADYAFINSYLRFPEGGNKSDKEHFMKIANNIDSAFEKTPPLKGEEVVYRGLRVDKKMRESLVKDAIIKDPAFMSTSRDREVAKSFGDTIMTIRVPKGSKAIQVSDIAQTAATSREKELLLPRNTQLKITHVREEKGGFLGMGKKTYIEARVIQ